MSRVVGRKPKPAFAAGPRAGFTLLETTVSVAVVSVIMLAIGSAVLLAGKAIPSAESPPQCTLRAAAQAEWIAEELQYALSVAQRTQNSIEFTIPDQTGDGLPEQISYQWSGTAGDPILRQYNYGAAREVLANVHQFQLQYDLESISENVASYTEGPEMLLSSFLEYHMIMDYGVDASNWVGQYIRPVLPVGVVSWKVTRVSLFLGASGDPSGQSSIQLRTATAGGLPGMTVLDEEIVNEGDLNGQFYSWLDFSFNGASVIPPDQGVCLVIKHISGSESCRTPINMASTGGSDMHLVMTGDGGQSWTARQNRSMLLTAYGTFTTAGEPTVQTRYFLPRVSLTVQVGSEPGSAVHTAATILNRPEVTGP